MDWVKSFYTKQQEWANVYSGDIMEDHRKRVNTVKKLCGSSPQQILELGAGGGQFAVAAAEFGYNVTAVELISSGVQQIKKLSKRPKKGTLNIIEGDFYNIKLNNRFDVVCYWDGFGIGSDEEQKYLLERISKWLKPNGSALIDIYTPWYWSKVVGVEMEFINIKRHYSFDFEECRMLDRWCPKEDENQAVTQSLRCYSPADLDLLLQDTGLRIESIEPGGAMNYETMKYIEKVPLEQAMSYLVKLVIN